jgi:hypothetical protein
MSRIAWHSEVLYSSAMDAFVTLPQLAARLGLKSIASLRHQIARGRLQARKVGRDWLVTEAEAERYAREHLGKRGFASTDHPYHGTRPPRRERDGELPE